MYRLPFSLFLAALTWSAATFGQHKNQKIKAARGVLERVLGTTRGISLELVSKNGDLDFYQYQAKNGILHVAATSADALTRGVYDYLKSWHRGMLDWTGASFKDLHEWPETGPVKTKSPFKFRQAYNAVTPAYTTAYWNWDRWEQELDWQAMHGFNMLMVPSATEAIAHRVWEKLGLTRQEIDSFYVSPSLLPFVRMGCIQNVGGTLPPEWHKAQIGLQHKILKRMRELGMKPIIQSFAGFVPPALKRIYPQLRLHTTMWNPGFPISQRPVMLMPGDPLFARITKMYIEEWEKEFGKSEFYLVDSFNELELPKTNAPVTELLAAYGEFTYNAIKAAQPNATWVIQGWMFGYQRKQWPPENVHALFSRVPDNKVLILDYANDYANSWEPVNGFNGKQWIFGYVPNMGGKTAYTGDLKLYASGSAKILKEPGKNNLTGFSISGEGLENNTVVYELLTDAAWTDRPIELKNWLRDFSINRYGSCPQAMDTSWELLLGSSYSKLVPHPQFNWQLGNYRISEIDRSTDFFRSVQLFLACRNEIGTSKNYVADAVERVGITLGLVAERYLHQAGMAFDKKDTIQAQLYHDKAVETLRNLDRLMESHPLNRLERWINFASGQTTDPGLAHFYEADARRIVTVWGPPVNDYSCRVWSGLIRDFYIPRLEAIMESKKTGTPFKKDEWELHWVNHAVLSNIQPFEAPLEAAVRLFESATATD